MLTIKNEIQPGCRVVIPGYMYWDNQPRRGTVETRQANMVRVKVDGRKLPAICHLDNVEPET